MPQDSLRSAVYRSFVTCDDPKGVIECRTIRKAKTSSKKSEGNKVERSRSPNEGGEEMSSKNVAENSGNNPSSYQLMEVSQGAQKLNQVIDSWSKGASFNEHSKEIAKDLLKGALDLQESLIMLGKLQEASQYMVKLKKNQKEKSREERIDRMGIERANSDRFTDHNYQIGFQNQKPRLSVDGYSRSCQEGSEYVDELKKNQKEKSRGEGIDQMGVERMTSHRFVDHNYQMGFQKPRLSVDGYSRGCKEGSEYMDELKKKQKEKSRGERIDQIGVERANSHRFADHSYQMEFQKPRLSVDGYSRGCEEGSEYMDESKKKQKEKSRGEKIDQMGLERANSDRFMDRSYQMGFQKPRLSVDGYSRDFQEGYQCVDELKKKQKEKSRGQRIDQMGVERAKSQRFVDQNYQMGFQKPRLSADGYSSDCIEELRAAIRDGLARQNLLPPSCADKKAYCDKRTLDSALVMASTSSSQSSIVNFHSVASSLSSLSSKAPQKSKGSNLIAKLMGLEEIPSQALQTTTAKKLESEKVSSQRRPTFEIDMPKARKPQSAAYNIDTEQRKLKEIVETMQYKGLLKSNSAEGFGLASNSKKRFTEDAPPIVIIKPMRFSSVEEEEPHLQKFIRDVGGLNSYEVLRKLKKNEGAQTTDHGEEALNSNEMFRRFKGEEAPIKRLSREGAEKCKEVQEKPEETEVKTYGKQFSNKLKVSVSANQEQKQKAIEKKVDKNQKVSPCRRKPEEMESVKSKPVSKSRDQAKVTYTKERKPEIGSNTTKARISQQKSTSPSPISKHTTLDMPHGYADRKKTMKSEKPVMKSLAANLVVENVGCKYGDKLIESIELTCENETDMTRTSSTADRLLTEERTEASEIQIKDQCDGSQNFPCNVTPVQTIQHESSLKSAEEATECTSHDATEKKCFTTKTNEKDLLLSSPSFLSYADELFDIKSNWTFDGLTPDSCLNDSEKADSRLLFDCANELMQHKSIRCMQTIHPLLLTRARKSNIAISLAQLVEEVSNEIENLRSYSKHAGEKRPTDGLYAVLETDLRCEGVVSGAWDLGWRHAFSVDEVEQVVGDIEKLVFSGLIEEMFTDFVH